MSRPTSETLGKARDFFDSLPDEIRGKCALCSETLTHIIKQAEVETGAGTATATRILAEKINETAAPADKVTSDSLRDRVRRTEGKKESGRTAQIKTKTPKVEPATEPPSIEKIAGNTLQLFEDKGDKPKLDDFEAACQRLRNIIILDRGKLLPPEKKARVRALESLLQLAKE